MDQLGESIRKLILAGIGAAAVTKEKSESILRDLVKKGELTVEQGKVLNEELKHSVKEAIRDNVTVHVVKPEEDLDNLDDAQLEALRQRVQAAQEKRAQAAPAQAPIKPETETEPAPEQLELYQAQGWKYAFPIGRSYFLFYAENPEAIDLYTDYESRGMSL